MATDLFDEVNEDIRAERIRSAARRWAWVAGAGLVVVLGCAGAWEYHVSRENKTVAAASAVYMKDVRITETAVGSKAEDVPLTQDEQAGLNSLKSLAGSAPHGIAVMARMQAASLSARHGDVKGALDLWDKVSSDSSAEQGLRDAAALFWCQWQIDSSDIPRLRSRLMILTGKDKPWDALATESLAILDLRENHIADARKRLTRLTNDMNAPQSVRGRAGSLLNTLNDGKAG
ncbi:hypothetical protein LOC54_00720 [Acetobacter sp. AN02]|uniref:hypothetical protein n=1 Tax=Acetobacter sp. AN02 TaxID=2894186 RepID=UPI0024343DF9|nr:hypothetical protein [Acetobacter sp. AN02]MDG6093648.1 hypothetical protein [Acetobacter sp. AN02]